MVTKLEPKISFQSSLILLLGDGYQLSHESSKACTTVLVVSLSTEMTSGQPMSESIHVRTLKVFIQNYS